MKVTVIIDPKAATKEGFAVVSLHEEGGTRLCQLDLEFSKLSALTNPNPRALDFLLIAAAVYALDKLVVRETAGDAWTRGFELTLPVSDPAAWKKVQAELTDAVSFLTGDIWEFTFSRLQSPLIRPIRKRRRRRRILVPPLRADVVCLFSGGLDSLIGAIDRLETRKSEKLLLVGHHDGQIAGPLSDQKGILEQLQPFYPERTRSLFARVGHTDASKDITLRGRSLIFIALGIYAASALSPEVPLLIPENGTIAVNVPLTPSRRGSCSTRTTHPQFLTGIGRVLVGLGIKNALETPLEWKTKGEAVSECKNLKALRTLAPLSVSCAKPGHTSTWINRSANGCGRCMPCIYRRAALHTIGLDTEPYGRDICKGEVDIFEHGELGPNDLRACFSFLNRRASTKEIERMLIASGSLDVSRLTDYAKLVERAMDEIRTLLNDKATPEIKRIAGLSSSNPSDA
jgi:hypothetical protein